MARYSRKLKAVFVSRSDTLETRDVHSLRMDADVLGCPGAALLEFDALDALDVVGDNPMPKVFGKGLAAAWDPFMTPSLG